MSIKYFESLPRASAESLSGKVLAQVRREFGAEVEPFTLHLPVAELLAGVWMACRETLLAGSGRRDAKEVVAASVSALNRCPFCVDAHSIMLLESSGNDYSNLITGGKTELIDDLFLRETAAWASATRCPGSPVLQKPPFTAEEAPAFIGTAVLFHYINRMVTILLGPSPLPFTSGFPKKVSMQMAAWFFGGAIRRPKEPGTSLDLLAEAPLPDDLFWAQPSKPIAGAFARFAQVVEHSGAMTLSAEVRRAVNKAVEKWNGSDPGMNNGWCEEALSALEVTDKTAGRLALFTALAPYRVDASIVHAFSASFPGDDRLLSALAWSSFTAARKVGSWL
ncbi:carboxymuconolactone decarboxylase family protein [Pelodictyon phaeoclathratiforme]|jgi:AhpD family alkylhydroperoxidase|uniref:Alkylhydroperoxidase like protein, AhpD family n=1 Tax=Pelodictyon phaeoclathratiforme (strain DSM 5477 / BU-1) TaxID=324925 RepID=B4SBD8_PELPB|nr:carboxymuconolactone decarboxylase family protein [Pelodictyon phaeoclathratiforme]ACF43992.1 alkylhydroperoxidase like protein, AhpD family [Pelodictyon phaeoclathratiforme BU-1]MBV5288328.1 carboxymuconolactone decarboxylase family protein [Pelodictyon phaeoclathratiforme]